MSYLTGFAGEYEGQTRLELVQSVLEALGSPITTYGTDTAADYSRYAKAGIIKHLNEAQTEYVRKTKCLTTWAIIETVADRQEYRLPRRCLHVLDAKYYTGTSDYDQLRILTDRSMLKRHDSTWRTGGSGTPELIAPGYGYGNVRSFISYPKPASDGTTYSGTTMGIVTAATDFTFSGEVTGTHHTSFPNTASLVDAAGRDFTTLGVTVGMMLFNTTDGSKGQITGIANQQATNDKLLVTLSGGTDDHFDIGDSFVVAVGEYGVVIRADNSEEWAFTSNYGSLQDISPLSGNFLIDFVKRPMKLDIDTQYPEINPELNQALAEYAIWKLGVSEFNGKVAQARAQEAKGLWMKALEEYGVFSEPELEDNGLIEDREMGIYGY